MRGKMLGCAVLLMLYFIALPVYGADCSGGWKVLRNYQPGRGGPCKILGLDTNVGVCQSGHEYETLCDDASNGRYRVCQGPRRCSGSSGQAPPQSSNCTSWDYKRNRPCPSGYVNTDCRGSCESSPQNDNNCTSWDYQRNQPCPPGYRNPDCRGGCE